MNHPTDSKEGVMEDLGKDSGKGSLRDRFLIPMGLSEVRMTRY
jgi:hypothetical protein